MQKIFLVSFLAVLTTFVAVRCGRDTASSTPTYAYAGPGSTWRATLNSDGTFVITRAEDADAEVDLTVNGTYSRLSTGFVHLTVSSSSGSGGPSAGDEAFGLEVAGFAFLLKPVGGDSNLIPMVVSGTCPTDDFDANWVMVKKDAGQSAADNGNDFFGTFSWDTATTAATLPSKYALESFTSLGGNLTPMSGTCSEGIMELSGQATMFLTAAGGAIVHTNSGTPSDDTDDSFIFAFPKDTLTSGTQISGDYAGLVFDDDAGSGDRIKPVSVSLTGTASGASGTGTVVTNVTTGATSSDTVTITLNNINTPSAGFMTGNISGSGNELVCTVDLNSAGTGKNVINCIGQSPNDNTKMFNVLLVSK